MIVWSNQCADPSAGKTIHLKITSAQSARGAYKTASVKVPVGDPIGQCQAVSRDARKCGFEGLANQHTLMVLLAMCLMTLDASGQCAAFWDSCTACAAKSQRTHGSEA